MEKNQAICTPQAATGHVAVMAADTMTLPRFPAAHIIKEIGRGIKGARNMSQSDAHALYAAMLNGQVSDLELGGILLSMRIKGESADEIAGFFAAVETSFQLLQAPKIIGAALAYAPIVIPSYNGARRTANLTPLLAMLLARAGAPVFVHGVMHDAGRVTTAEILNELGIAISSTHQQAEDCMAQGQVAFMNIETLAPKLAGQLAFRKLLGVRNSAHTLVKILQPFNCAALRLCSYTHPEYSSMLTEYLTHHADPLRGDVFLMRGTEGETVASTKKIQKIDWIHQGSVTTVAEAEVGTDLVLPIALDAVGTAVWIQDVMAGREPVPENIAAQVQYCLNAAANVYARTPLPRP